MNHRDQLVAACDHQLRSAQFKDFTVNGLQIEGREQVRRVMSGVTACQALLDEAVAWQADMVLVHHGYFWKNEPVAITGMKQRRIKTLLANDINLLAYHLPLDAHAEMGNNAQLAKRMGWKVEGCLDGELGEGLLWSGRLVVPQSIGELARQVAGVLAREPLLVEAPYQKPIERVAWCTGGAQDMITEAYEAGAQVFVSGEISERTTHLAREMGIHYLAAGHHATERYGVQALGEWLASEFDVEHRFVDIDNPA
ncbi:MULTISPECIES: Nif3-like dinuclear metal center hexameric protein [Halomonadaceae]|uniref:Nif3-like dinuclear metal center hexameric protein n=1 Tax=Halomonadaceae TaxID=28256 RepID=UPI00111A677F|nr:MULTISPECIES: Nif3-like dinuclear metal center hexameric protein [Halomonas]MCG7589089.1 Nif3-like dinuclear metal center hexameric protein [Halomonas sp. McD50-5]MCG7615250.1 Nif3-like dinuclear metal center hexameric protein [Halomonas sp. McD50-4]TNH16773.1 Nif3-like dinuclear metal center hexameric protein [Halomonas sp. BL6]